MTKHTVLVLAANPHAFDPGRLDPKARRSALDQEVTAIRKELKRSGYRDRFDLVPRLAAEPHDLLRELRELKPTVLHFSGHGGRDGLVFEAANGNAQVVSFAALAETLGAAGGSVKLVILSACYSAEAAEALLKHVDCVVGMPGALSDAMARAFAIGFYGALGERETIAAAYRQGNAAISLEGLADADRPRLQVRGGGSASEVVLADDDATAHQKLPCPYPGMRSYGADDAAHFHGRDAEIGKLIGRLRAGKREIFVIGPSGSGKSSLVAAGMLPRLARGVAGLGPFVVRMMRPGEEPATRLAEQLEIPDRKLTVPVNAIVALLAGRSPNSSVLLVIDQLEELFTLAEPDERAQFLSALEALRAAARCTIVYTLRADFFGAFMESSLWTRSQGQITRIEVGPLRDESLREAIMSPAGVLGVTVAPDLIRQLLADVGSEPGVLPLLQETLIQLWDRRHGQTLTLADYQALGDGNRSGLAVALSHRADALLEDLTAAQVVLTRRILLRLISFGEGRSDTRRQQPRSKLRAADDRAVDFDDVLQPLITARLLTADEDEHGHREEARIDLAHEVMITAWPTLAGWVQAHRAAELRRRHLEAAAAEWVKRGRGAGGLLDPVELMEAEAWQETDSACELGQSDDATALIAASRAAHDKQRRRRRVLLGSAFAALGGFTVVITMLAVMARRQATEAEDSRHDAETSRKQAEAERVRAETSDHEHQSLLAQSYQEAGRQELLAGSPQEAIPYLMAARQKGENGESLRMLIWMAAQSLPITLIDHQGEVWRAAFSPDGTRVVTASEDQTARIWDTTTGKLLTPPLEHQGGVWDAAFSPDGTHVVTASLDKTARIWNAVTGKLCAPPLEHQGGVWSVAFSADGTRVVTASDDKTARVWNAATGKLIISPLKHEGAVRSATFSPDGTRVVTASDDQTARVWDLGTGRPLGAPLEHQDVVNSAAFSPDGKRIVTASADKTSRIWDAATGQLLVLPLKHEGEVRSAAFSPNGTRVVTTSDDRRARIWESATGKSLIPSLEHQGKVLIAAFSADGTRVITASDDKTARIWNAATGRLLAPPLKHQGRVWSATFSADGSRIATASEDKTARIWSAATRDSLAPLEHRGGVWSAAFSPDGTHVITASLDKTARIWATATGKLVTSLVHQGGVRGAAFSPDGTRVVTASDDRTARVWDAATGRPLAPPLEHQGKVSSAVFSPNGARVVTASDDKTARVWDTVTGRPLTPTLEHQGEVWSATFSPDGTRVVTASLDKTARVWEVTTGKPHVSPFEHQGGVFSAAFSPDGTRVVTASDDKTARVWDATTGKLIISPLEHHGEVRIATFSPDGTRVVTASLDQTARVWDAATGKPVTAPLEHQGWVKSAAFSRDGTRVITASEDQTARIWDATTGKPLTSALEHNGGVRSAAFSPDGMRVVTASLDHTARVWEAGLDETVSIQWSALAARSPFVLRGSVLVQRISPVHTSPLRISSMRTSPSDRSPKRRSYRAIMPAPPPPAARCDQVTCFLNGYDSKCCRLLQRNRPAMSPVLPNRPDDGI